MNLNPTDKNMGLKILFDCGPSEDYKSESLFIRAFLKEKYFTDMRTQRQLGYSVSSGGSTANFIHRITFSIQGEKETPNKCAELTYDFIEEKYKELCELSQEDFETMKKGASTTFLEPIKNLYIRYENDIVEILNNTFDYNSDAADYKCLMS